FASEPFLPKLSGNYPKSYGRARGGFHSRLPLFFPCARVNDRGKSSSSQNGRTATWINSRSSCLEDESGCLRHPARRQNQRPELRCTARSMHVLCVTARDAFYFL